MNLLRQPITIQKLNLAGEEAWRYSGWLISHHDNEFILEAAFDMPDTSFHNILFNRGDIFIETYYTNRWYNILEIHDLNSNEIKGWYCNVAYPAVLNDGVLSYIDLALDLLVYPDGFQVVLDEEEFDELTLDSELRDQSLAALEELKSLFKAKFQ